MGSNIKLFGSSGADRPEKKKKAPAGPDTASFEAIRDNEPAEAMPAAPAEPAVESEPVIRLEPAAQHRQEPKKPAPKPEKKSSAGKRALITIAIVLAVLCAAAAGLGFYVNGTDTIFPKVSLFGVAVGNMTKAQAQEKLTTLGWDKTDASVTVLLPLERSLTVRAEDAGAFVSSEAASIAAYNFCHGGNMLENLVTWVKCATVGTEINVVPNMDEAAVRKTVSEEIAALTEGLMSSGMEITDDSVKVVKGASAVTVDEDELVSLITEALRSRSYGQIEYEVQVGEPEPLDLEALHESVYAQVADAYYDSEKGGVVEAVVGRDFDKNAAQRLWDAADYGDTVVIPLDVTEPKLSTKELEDMLFRDVLSTWTTSLLGSTSNRIANVTLSADIINGTVLEPGETFSYNGALGQRTAERGFKYAGAYSGGQVVQEIGGGICQVSSTIYYCSMLANLEIVDRSCHYFPVGYLPPGLDATVSWKIPDFKFKNSRDYPVRLELSVDDEGKSLTVSVLGTDLDGSYVQMTYATWAVYNNSDYPEVATGYKAATYRNVFDKDGNLISRELEAYSEYHYHEEDIEFVSPSPSAVIPTTEPTAPVVTTPPEPTGEIAPPEDAQPAA